VAMQIDCPYNLKCRQLCPIAFISYALDIVPLKMVLSRVYHYDKIYIVGSL
jgi:hypothetical protein